MNFSNFSNFSNIFDNQERSSFIENIHTAMLSSVSIILLLGTLLNLWQLFAIIFSADLRSRMRNKLIISTCFLHLTECTIQFPILLSVFAGVYIDCLLISAYINLHLMQDFIANWTFVTMVVVFIFQIMDIKTPNILSNLSQRILTAVILLLPWIASLVTIPAMVHVNKVNWECFLPDSLVIFRSIDTAVPLALASALTVFALVKKRQRFTRGFQSASGMQVELISRGPEVDESAAYVTGVVVCLLCESVFMVLMLELLNFTDYKTKMILQFTAGFLADSRVIFMTLPWLLFSDVRTRMKTWRPWYRPAAGIDLTVNYRKQPEG